MGGGDGKAHCSRLQLWRLSTLLRNHNVLNGVGGSHHCGGCRPDLGERLVSHINTVTALSCSLPRDTATALSASRQEPRHILSCCSREEEGVEVECIPFCSWSDSLDVLICNTAAGCAVAFVGFVRLSCKKALAPMYLQALLDFHHESEPPKISSSPAGLSCENLASYEDTCRAHALYENTSRPRRRLIKLTNMCSTRSHNMYNSIHLRTASPLKSQPTHAGEEQGCNACCPPRPCFKLHSAPAFSPGYLSRGSGPILQQ